MTRALIPRLAKPWRPRPLLPLLTLVVLAVGVATSAGVGLRTAARDSAPAAAVTHSIEIANFAFAPQVLAVTAGDTITWTNQDEAPHTVTTTSGPRSISSPMLSKGQSFTYTFVVPGTYSYYCAVHPDMRAQVVVNPAPVVASTPSPSGKRSSAAPPQPTRSATGGVVHATTPTTTHSGQEPMSATGSTVTSSASSVAASVSSATPGASAASASVPTSASESASAPATDAAAVPSATSGGRPLDPALVLAGLTTGATVFCLLLVASRRNDES